jgi:hypothetical protein
MWNSYEFILIVYLVFGLLNQHLYKQKLISKDSFLRTYMQLGNWIVFINKTTLPKLYILPTCLPTYYLQFCNRFSNTLFHLLDFLHKCMKNISYKSACTNRLFDDERRRQKLNFSIYTYLKTVHLVALSYIIVSQCTVQKQETSYLPTCSLPTSYVPTYLSARIYVYRIVAVRTQISSLTHSSQNTRCWDSCVTANSPNFSL